MYIFYTWNTVFKPRELLEGYFKDTGRPSAAFDRRWNEVSSALARSGSYELTADELEYAARLAWRNAPRCSIQIFILFYYLQGKRMFSYYFHAGAREGSSGRTSSYSTGGKL